MVVPQTPMAVTLAPNRRREGREPAGHGREPDEYGKRREIGTAGQGQKVLLSLDRWNRIRGLRGRMRRHDIQAGARGDGTYRPMRARIDNCRPQFSGHLPPVVRLPRVGPLHGSGWPLRRRIRVRLQRV